MNSTSLTQKKQGDSRQTPGSAGGSSTGISAIQLRGLPLSKQMDALDPNQQTGFEEASRSLGPVQCRGGDGGSGVHEAAARGTAEAGGSLPHLGTIQAAFGAHDVSNVQAYVGGAAAEATKSMGAEAYAMGNKVAFGAAPSLHTAAHEAAHVVQQRSGVQLSGGVGQSGDTYERQADAVADAVVQGKSAEGLLGNTSSGRGASSVPSGSVQRKDDKGTRRATAKAHMNLTNATAIGERTFLTKQMMKPVTVRREGNFYFNLAARKGMTSDVENWILNYNNTMVPYNGMVAAGGRLAILQAAGINFMKPESYADEFEEFGLTVNENQTIVNTRQHATNSKSPKGALTTVRAAQDSLKAVVAALQVERNKAQTAKLAAKKAGLQAEVAAIQQKIATIVGWITKIEGLAVKAAAAYSTMGASVAMPSLPPQSVDIASSGQKSAGSAVGGHAKAGGMGISLGAAAKFVLDTQYAPELAKLSKEMGGIDVKMAEIEGNSMRLNFSEALSRVKAASSTLDASKVEMKQARGARRQAMQDLGLGIDQARMKESSRDGKSIGGAKTETGRKDGASRATGLLTAAQAVSELWLYLGELNTQIFSMEDGRKLMERLVDGISTIPKIGKDGGLVWSESDAEGRKLGNAMVTQSQRRQEAKSAMANIGKIQKEWRRISRHVVQHRSE